MRRFPIVPRSKDVPSDPRRRVHRTALPILFGLCLAGLVATPGFAQSESGGAALEGLVRGPDAKTVPNASVKITASDTGYTRTVVAHPDGRFVAPLLPVGRYSIEATAPGFNLGRRDNVVLRVGATQTVDIDLTLASLSDQITVSSDTGMIDRTEPAASLTIEKRSITDLPVRGRNFPEFIQLTPSVIQESDRFGLVISGQRSINSNVAIDGADYNDALQGNQRGGNEGVFFFPQAVEEFQVVRVGATASVGRTSAGFVNVVTKSGTNDLHGELFYFNRNRHLTSPNAFGRSLDNRQN
jgi:Carboxypeptidase regulatory-like domain